MIAVMPLAQTTVTVTGTGQGGTPVISGFSGPTTLGVNQIGTWKIVASDPENGTLNYNVTWGDEWGNNTGAALMREPQASIQQNTTFTHSYQNAGTYTVGVTVSDSSGYSARTTASVAVTQNVCTTEYAPVCARPNSCVNTCSGGQMCPAYCQLPQPQTYSNRCVANNANATFMHDGACTGNEGYTY
jgi:hypothetical protein